MPTRPVRTFAVALLAALLGALLPATAAQAGTVQGVDSTGASNRLSRVMSRVRWQKVVSS